MREESVEIAGGGGPTSRYPPLTSPALLELLLLGGGRLAWGGGLALLLLRLPLRPLSLFCCLRSRWRKCCGRRALLGLLVRWCAARGLGGLRVHHQVIQCRLLAPRSDVLGDLIEERRVE